MTDSETARPALADQVAAFLGRQGPPGRAPDPVNAAMIRHWCEALGDWNPIYTDAAFAERSVHGSLVAPPAMLDVWTMSSAPSGPVAEVMNRLDAAGYTSVVATNAEHEYDRYLHPGERLTATGAVTDFSAEKQTGLGRGYFLTTTTELRVEDGTPVGRARLRMLKFMPGTGRVAEGPAPGGVPARRPRPGVSRDTRFFWDGIARGELRIQRCAGCQRLRHPPVVRCPDCGSYEQGWVVALGRGTVYSFVEPCHPKLPAFSYPYVVGLVELEEGTRLLTNIVDIEPDLVEVGLPVEVVFRAVDPELTLPLFRPRCPPRCETTPAFAETREGDRLPPFPVPITTTLIVAAAIASRDFTPVHHDAEAARAQGSPDIFMNILTTNGLVSRYVTDWAGPEARLRKLSIRLGVPNYPGDVMTFSGSVLSRQPAGSGSGVVEIGVRGVNRLGPHVTGTVSVELPGRPGAR